MYVLLLLLLFIHRLFVASNHRHCSLNIFSFIQMILKLICALVAMITQFFGVYGEGKFEWGYA